MAIAETAGVETVGTTEWSLTTDTAGPDADTTDCIMQALVDLSAMAGGDEFRIRIYEKVQGAGDTQRVAYQANMVGPQSPPLWASPSLILMHGWDVTVTKIAGTDRLIGWSIRKVS